MISMTIAGAALVICGPTLMLACYIIWSELRRK